MMAVCHALCVLAFALCCNTLCVMAAGDGGGGGDSQTATVADLRAAVAEKAADVKRKKGAFEAARNWRWAAEDAAAALKEAQEAVDDAKKTMGPALKNAEMTAGAANKLSTAAASLKTLQLPAGAANSRAEDVNVKTAKAVVTQCEGMLVTAKNTMLDAAGLMKQTGRAVARAEVALRHVKSAKTNTTGAEQPIIDTVQASRAVVTKVRAAVDKSVVEVRNVYDAALELYKALNTTLAAAREASQLLTVVGAETQTNKDEILKNVINNATEALEETSRASTKSKNALGSIKAAGDIFERAIQNVREKESGAAEALQMAEKLRKEAEDELAPVRAELQQLNDKLKALEATTKVTEKELPTNDDSSDAESPPIEETSVTSEAPASTAETSEAPALPPVAPLVPTENNTATSNNNMLDNFTDSSDIPAWVRAPLLLLLACVAVW
ncbi:hypothetical protein DQ04_12841010 [Trypanosoma grayi]|uniref:hypothetical protein n=1 Tax=Trypanosoma grayi TaxID=71804 RepID=UPI0004F47A62|nr:hypothetical protein DQ04_12841010 [Trypanosoma grayi]KEG06663.1 hypothetical protein DQ04_12841010 [Trypanosoma grayi]